MEGGLTVKLLTQICGTSEYVLFLIGLCGEVETDEILKLENVSEDYSKKVIAKLIKDKVIRKFTYDTEKYKNAKEVLRLREGWGTEKLKDLSEELILHYDLIRGPKGNRNKGDFLHKDRTRKSSKISQMLYKTGVSVDMMWHETVSPLERYKSCQEKTPSRNSYAKLKSIFDEDTGQLLDPIEIINMVSPGEEAYFTSKALARLNSGGSEKAKNILSKAHGLLIKDEKIIPIYYFSSGYETWTKEAEVTLMFIVNHIKRELGRRITSEKGEAIFYIEDPAVISDFIIPSKKIKRRIKPEEVCEKAYMIPVAKNHEEIRRMVLVKDYEEKCNEMLLGENAIRGQHYAGVVNGTKIYNLLSCDIVRMKRLKEAFERIPGAVIIHSWQEELVENLYGKEIQKVVLTDEEFYELVSRLQY